MAFRGIRLVRPGTKIDFVGYRRFAFATTCLLIAITLVAMLTRGLNLGIDFVGGTLIEIASPQPIDVAQARSAVSGLGLGQIDIQEFGGPGQVLIRVQAQPTEAEDAAAVAKVREALGGSYEYRRVERVGPKVGSELMQDGIIAALLAMLGIAMYVYFRFEWQFAVAAMAATVHDVVVTVGLFSVLQLDFDLTAIAALLTVAGYSINDTVVVFDRIREMMRRQKSADLATIINASVNETLSRTVLTAMTTLLAVIPLLLFGGSALENFSVALTWGILIGIFSTVFVASALLLYMPSVRESDARSAAAVEGPPAQR